ncbi:uncharacterized protein PpBr36_11037 [Pyricularia pennisetigena]|uniref:uncharacterized protein n=1 Tax=Pyricularia pennisetigena TaxID=1578925 RepID=UPI001151DDB7|nr:uncharacterized protein PpBr36_11037 [Pyricularia pennisetigena]TLS20685.1 hypothetical protein PpBr36_11037 [Pyricularia pennisetigena]
MSTSLPSLLKYTKIHNIRDWVTSDLLLTPQHQQNLQSLEETPMRRPLSDIKCQNFKAVLCK